MGRPGARPLHPDRRTSDACAGRGGATPGSAGREGGADGLCRSLFAPVRRVCRDRSVAPGVGALRRTPPPGHDRPGHRPGAPRTNARSRPPGRHRHVHHPGGFDRARGWLSRLRDRQGLRRTDRPGADRRAAGGLRGAVRRRRDPLSRLAAFGGHAQVQPRLGRRALVAGLHLPALRSASALGRHGGHHALRAVHLRLGALRRQPLGCHGLARGLELADLDRLRGTDHRPRCQAARVAGPPDAAGPRLADRWSGGAGGKRSLQPDLPGGDRPPARKRPIALRHRFRGPASWRRRSSAGSARSAPGPKRWRACRRRRCRHSGG